MPKAFASFGLRSEDVNVSNKDQRTIQMNFSWSFNGKIEQFISNSVKESLCQLNCKSNWYVKNWRNHFILTFRNNINYSISYCVPFSKWMLFSSRSIIKTIFSWNTFQSFASKQQQLSDTHFRSIENIRYMKTHLEHYINIETPYNIHENIYQYWRFNSLFVEFDEWRNWVGWLVWAINFHSRTNFFSSFIWKSISHNSTILLKLIFQDVSNIGCRSK